MSTQENFDVINNAIIKAKQFLHIGQNDAAIEQLKMAQKEIAYLIDLIEKHKWLTSQGGISSEGFGLE